MSRKYCVCHAISFVIPGLRVTSPRAQGLPASLLLECAVEAMQSTVSPEPSLAGSFEILDRALCEV